MAKELYLYSPIYSWTAEGFIRQLEENAKDDITVRIMSPGGGVFAGWGMAAKMREKKIGTLTAKVDGVVASMASTLLFYFDKVKALNVSSIMIHRADGPKTTPEEKALLDKVNADLRAAMEKKIDNAKLMTLKGKSIKDLFESEPRIDLYLSADEAKQIGLVDEVYDMDPKEIAAMGDYGKLFQIAATSEVSQTEKTDTMTLAEIKAKFPQLYADIRQEAVVEERDRVLAWAHFGSVDADAVKKGIESGKNISQVQIIEFAEKKANGTAINSLKEEVDANGNKIEAGTKAEQDKKAQEKIEAEKKSAESAEFWSNVSAFTGVKI